MKRKDGVGVVTIIAAVIVIGLIIIGMWKYYENWTPADQIEMNCRSGDTYACQLLKEGQ